MEGEEQTRIRRRRLRMEMTSEGGKFKGGEVKNSVIRRNGGEQDRSVEPQKFTPLPAQQHVFNHAAWCRVQCVAPVPHQRRVVVVRIDLSSHPSLNHSRALPLSLTPSKPLQPCVFQTKQRTRTRQAAIEIHSGCTPALDD